jgi:hypothetical protein
MTRSIISIGVVTLMVAGAGSVAARQAFPTDKASGVIVGRVVDADTGAPVPGVVVHAARVRADTGAPPASRESLLTDPQGRFVFGGLADGAYMLTTTVGGSGFSPSGFLVTGLGHQIGAYLNGGHGQQRPDGPLQAVDVGPPSRRADVTIRLWKGGAVNGYVTDEAGEPLVDMVVGAVRRTREGKLLTGPTTRTDDRGAYRLGTLHPGEYAIVVPQAQLLMPEPVVRTRDANTLLPAERGGRRYVYRSTFHPSIVAIGPGEDRQDVNVRLVPVPAVEVEGTVVGRDGPTGGIGIHVVPPETGDGSSVLEVAAAVSNPDGTFAFPAVPAGAYRLLAIPPRAQAPDGPSPGWAEQPLEVGADAVRGVTVVLQPGRDVTGRFEFHGSASAPPADQLSRVTLTLTRSASLTRSNPGSVTGRVAGDGTFAVRDVRPGRYLIAARDLPPDWTVQSVGVAGRDVTDAVLAMGERDLTDVVVVFTDRPASVRGTVSRDGGPIDAGLAVFLFPADESRWPDARVSTRTFRTVRPFADGGFTIPNVVPGEYLVAAVPDVVAGDWPDAPFLAALAPQGTRVRVDPNQAATVTLRPGRVR